MDLLIETTVGDRAAPPGRIRRSATTDPTVVQVQFLPRDGYQNMVEPSALSRIGSVAKTPRGRISVPTSRRGDVSAGGETAATEFFGGVA